MAKSPYARKEWHRKHSTSKEMRWLNKGMDAARKGVSSGRKSVQSPGSTQEDWDRAALSKGQMRAAIVVGAILPLLGVSALSEEKLGGVFLLVEFFLFIIPFLLAVLFFMVVNSIVRPKRKNKAIGADDARAEEQKVEPLNFAGQLYSPNPEWAGQAGLVDSRINAEILAPQFLKQAQESAKLLQTTTEPATFFNRYDFCLGRLIQLEECKKYGVSVSTTADLKKYQSLAFRDEAVIEFIRRTEEKYKTKIESLKTAKAKQNWAGKFHQAFEPYLPYMTDDQKTVLGEASAELYSLAEVSGKKELTEENNI